MVAVFEFSTTNMVLFLNYLYQSGRMPKMSLVNFRGECHMSLACVLSVVEA